MPRPQFVPSGPVLRNEPISRGTDSQPHACEYLTRGGGLVVYVCAKHPGGVSVARYRDFLKRDPRAKRWGWRTMLRDATACVMGRVRHADHKTVHLHTWHEVAMNSESRAPAMRHVAFLD